MRLNKRELLKIAGATAGTALLGPASSSAATTEADFTDLTGDVSPIGVDERLARVAKAQRLMEEHDIDAILLEPGSAMLYFSGVSWWRSERLTTVVIPRVGGIGIVTPFFEEPSVRESMTFGDDVRTWHEDESPFERVAGILRDRGIKKGRIGLEDTVRYFVVEGLKAALPDAEIVAALPVTQ
jgi:Xaa-Pro dipeptidase